MTLQDLFVRLVETVGLLAGDRLPIPVTTAHVEQAPRYDLIDPDGRNQHFHVFDFDTLMDFACAPDVFPKTPDRHLCRKHLSAQEHLLGAYQIARCNDASYVVEVDNDCPWGCDVCRGETRVYARVASGALQEHPDPG